MARSKHEAEWCLLQNQFESYEKHSLSIKLASVFLLPLSEAVNTNPFLVLLLLLILWLQDSIWKTFQARIGTRLLHIEKLIREEDTASELQFNSEYEKVDTKGIRKILEYAQNAIRPTVAFPHVALVLILIAFKASQIAP